MKLGSKLGVSTGALVLVMFLSALTVHLRGRQAKHISDHIRDQRMPLVSTLHDLRGHARNSLLELECSMIFGQNSAAHLAFSPDRSHTQQDLLMDLESFRQQHDRPDLGLDLTRLDRILDALEKFQAEELKVQTLSNLGTAEGAQQAKDRLEYQVLPLIQSMYENSVAIIDSQEALEKEEFLQLQQANDSVLWTLWTVTILGAIFGGVIAMMVAHRVTGSIYLLVERARSIAAGDLTGSPLDIHTHDEIGDLAYAMQQMQINLASIIGTVSYTAGSLTTSAISMRTASDQIHRRIDLQGQQTQQAATAMQEMSASISEVSRHTHTAADVARSAAQTAHEGGTIVQQMLGSMESIATAVSDTSSTVGLLGEDSRRISQIITVIDEIARKTNLLALNAAIEAARAGEQGRGFAVVAGEVRRLAESTAQATGEISAMIQGIQDRTRTAIASMSSGTLTVEQGVVTTKQAGEALERIIGMAERVDRMIAQIAIAASQQAAASDQSSASLDAIHSLSHENLVEMSTTAAGIESLHGTAASLEHQVESFQLSTHPAPRRTSTGPGLPVNILRKVLLSEIAKPAKKRLA